MTLRLLLIEDDDADASLIVRELKNGGYEVTSVRVDTAAALEAALAGPPWDLITCDWMMPRFSAAEALEILQRREVDAPIIIVTGEVGEEVAVTGMRAGARDVVSKNRLTRLVPAVRRELQEAEVRRARKRAEEALAESERHFRSLIEKALDVVGIVDTDGTIRYASPSHEQAIGYRPDELVGKNAFDFVHPDDREAVIHRFAAGLALGERSGSTRYRFRRKDGSWGVLEGVARNLTTDPVVHGVLVNSRDVTAREEAAREIERRAAEVSDLYENAPCGYHSLDRDGVFVRINDTELRWLGYDRGEVVGRLRATDLLTPASREIFRREYPFFLERGAVRDLELEFVRKDGSILPVLVNATTVTDTDGRFVMTRSTVTDLTERKRAEEALRASERRYRAFLEASPDAALVVRENGDVIDFANARAEQLFGYPREELLGHEIETLIPQSWHAAHREMRRRYAENPAAREMGSGREVSARRRDGSEFPADVMLGPLTVGDERLVFAVVRDITERKRAELALRERNRLVDAVFDHSLSCLVLLDAQFNFVRVNAAYARACRREMEDFVGRNHFDLYPSEARSIFEQVVESRQPFEVRARPFSFPDQPERGLTYWDWTLVPLLGEQGEVEFLLFSLHDVTAHVRAAEVVRSNQERLEVALRVADIAAFSQDRDLRYTWIDHPQLRYGVEEVLGRTDDELLPAAAAVQITAIKRRVVETGVGAREEIAVEDEGAVRHFDLALEPLRDAAGGIVGLTGASFDVTERKQAEEASRAHTLRLEILRDTYRAILEAHSTEAVIAAAVRRIRRLVPCDLAILFLFDAEAGAARVAAADASSPDVLRDIEPLTLDELPPLDRFTGRPEIYTEDIATLPPRSPVVKRLYEHGARAVLAETLVSEGQVVGVLALCSARPSAFGDEHREIAREVADQLAVAIDQARLHERLQVHAAELERRVRARTAQFEAANRELAAFSYSVSHDLRAPLRAIAGFGRALLEDEGTRLTGEARNWLDRIIEATDRMGHLIQDLLELSRVSQRSLAPQEVDLSEMVREIVSDLRRAEPHRAVEVVVAPGVVATGDRGLLRVALQNLLSNAWKYTSRRPVAHIEFGCRAEDGHSVYFVRDDGAGFDMKYVDKLFGAFQRLHPESEFEGTGIGLATVQRIVHRHEGRIWGEGAVERGATFSFTLGA